MKTPSKYLYLIVTISLLLAMILLIGCTAEQSRIAIGDEPGFWLGLWHGFIVLFTFIASLFTDVEVYAFPNNGAWYDFGFLLGIMIFFGGGGAKAKS